MNLVSLVLATTLVVPLFAAATGCQMTTSEPEVAAAGLYADLDNCLGVDCLTTLWIYQESNGIEGLQRGDEVVDDTCGGAAARPDTLIF